LVYDQDTKLNFLCKDGDVMELHIGMTIEEARELFSFDDITNEQDMRNGYYWIRGWCTLFSERTYVKLCFQEGILRMVDIMPHLSVEKDRPPFSLDMDDYRICQEWVEKHKNQLPDGTNAYYEYKTPSVGVCIR
jgi:hypothetical protein